MVLFPFGLNGYRGLVLPVFGSRTPDGFFTHGVKGVGEQIQDHPADSLGYYVHVSQALVKMGIDGGVEGSGTICRVYFAVKKDTPLDKSICFELSDVTSNDSQGNPIVIEPESTTMVP